MSPFPGTEPNWHSTIPVNTNQLSQSPKQGGHIPTSYQAWFMLTPQTAPQIVQENTVAGAKQCQDQLEGRDNKFPVPRTFAGTV